ncbi:uncharacterized protein LOC128988037 isoform X2 [Macrosteles quadrilineatus]|uniref:uncharacterized protein LOC128988037 isoform X2 n=1 Tax=Macrosteles quadrilineatus TaxID=74068 RepID=UPI0023E1D9DD|nr:uncharacterized protein LOC128988037 isoform X2 [Macrosteles quadrilineatus]
MASCSSWVNSCPECGKQIEVLNGDFEFSMNLHKQSHISLEAINRSLECPEENVYNTSLPKAKRCDQCNKDIEIINNDIILSFQLHVQNHKILKNSNIEKDNSKEPKGRKEISFIIKNIFHNMPSLQAHESFISEKDCKAFCNPCGLTIEPVGVSSVALHLKTKLHEDNTIFVIKTLIPSELQDQMNFISFYDSTLVCNLCSCKINLCSNNLHKTVVDIVAHNASQTHARMKSNIGQANKAVVILQTLALTDPLVKENMNIIESKMSPYYLCKLCDEAILYSENNVELLDCFKSHLNSPRHKRALEAVSLLKQWNALNIDGNKNHKFVVAGQTIHCLSCSVTVESNIDNLHSHVLTKSVLCEESQFDPENVKPSNLSSTQINLRLEENQKGPLIHGHNHFNKRIYNVKDVIYNTVLKTNVSILWSVKYFESLNDGYKCKLCNIEGKFGKLPLIEVFEKNITIHINGKKHQKQLLNEIENILKIGQLSSKYIQANHMFLTAQSGNAFCALCTCMIPLTDSDDTSIQNVITHLKGAEHSKRRGLSGDGQIAFLQSITKVSSKTIESKSASSVGSVDKQITDLPSTTKVPSKTIESKSALSVGSVDKQITDLPSTTKVPSKTIESKSALSVGSVDKQITDLPSTTKVPSKTIERKRALSVGSVDKQITDLPSTTKVTSQTIESKRALSVGSVDKQITDLPSTNKVPSKTIERKRALSVGLLDKQITDPSSTTKVPSKTIERKRALSVGSVDKQITDLLSTTKVTSQTIESKRALSVGSVDKQITGLLSTTKVPSQTTEGEIASSLGPADLKIAKEEFNQLPPTLAVDFVFLMITLSLVIYIVGQL